VGPKSDPTDRGGKWSVRGHGARIKKGNQDKLTESPKPERETRDATATAVWASNESRAEARHTF